MALITEEIKQQVTTGFQCDICKDVFENLNTLVHIKHTFGFFSPDQLDGSKVDATICEWCFAEIMKNEHVIIHPPQC